MERWLNIQFVIPRCERNQTQRGGYERSERSERSDRQQSVVQEDSTTVYVGNLTYEQTEEDLKDFFMSCGGIVDARIAKDRETNKVSRRASNNLSEQGLRAHGVPGQSRGGEGVAKIRADVKRAANQGRRGHPAAQRGVAVAKLVFRLGLAYPFQDRVMVMDGTLTTTLNTTNAAVIGITTITTGEGDGGY